MKMNQSEDDGPHHQTVAEGFEFNVGAKLVAVEFTEQKLSAHAGGAPFWAWRQVIGAQLPHRQPRSNNRGIPLLERKSHASG